jgi:GxxExxY protein
MKENEISNHIVAAAFRVHRGLGPGLFESVYEMVLARELEKRGLRVAPQQSMPVVFEGTRFKAGFRADLVVNESVIVEIKSVSEILAVHKKQLWTYLRLTGMHLGLLINFNVELIRDGITRVVNGLKD